MFSFPRWCVRPCLLLCAVTIISSYFSIFWDSSPHHLYSSPSYQTHQILARGAVNLSSPPVLLGREPAFVAEPIPTTQLLSVLTPVYNPNCKDIEKLYIALRQQTFRDFQWVIVDDHSTSRKCIKHYVGNWITHYYNDGARGLPNARNYGLARITSKYVVLQDADDYPDVTAFEKMIWFLELHPDFTMVSTYMVNVGYYQGIHEGGFFLGSTEYYKNILNVFTMMHTKRIQDTCTFDPLMTTGAEDWDFWLCLGARGHWG